MEELGYELPWFDGFLWLLSLLKEEKTLVHMFEVCDDSTWGLCCNSDGKAESKSYYVIKRHLLSSIYSEYHFLLEPFSE